MHKPLQIELPKNEAELNHLFNVVDKLYRKKYFHYKEVDDIIQQLLIQTNKAVNTYKAKNNAKFKTYLFFLLQNKEINIHRKLNDHQANFRKSMVHFSHLYWQNESENDTMEDHFNGELCKQVKTPIDEIILNEKKEGLKNYFENHVKMNCSHFKHRSDHETHTNTLYLYFCEGYSSPELQEELGITDNEVNNIIDGYRNYMKAPGNKPEIKFRNMNSSTVRRINVKRSYALAKEKNATTYRNARQDNRCRRLSKEIV